MYKIYALMVLALMPSMMFGSDTLVLPAEQAQEEQAQQFFEMLYYPAQDDNVTTIKRQVRSNPDYATLVHAKTGCSPLWILIGSLLNADNAGFRVAHLTKIFSKDSTSKQGPVSIYIDLFLFFLNEGAEIDFSVCPESLNLSEAQVPQVLRDVRFNFIWRKARKALVDCDANILVVHESCDRITSKVGLWEAG